MKANAIGVVTTCTASSLIIAMQMMENKSTVEYLSISTYQPLKLRKTRLEIDTINLARRYGK